MPLLSTAHPRDFKTLEDIAEEPQKPWDMSEEQQKRKKRIDDRVNAMIRARFPYEQGIKRSRLLYHGRYRNNPDDPRDETAVIPTAFYYVEAKTAEEVNSTQSYEFTPVQDSQDSWKVELLDQARKQAESNTQFQQTFIEWWRSKNRDGLGIMRTGYRCIYGKIKERVMEEDTGELLDWEEKTVTKYDDLFFELVSPFNFGVDPNCKSMEDAEDCFSMQIFNWNVFQERYATNELYENCESVIPGKFQKIGDGAMELDGKTTSDQVLVFEYFNKILDEWVTYANGVEIRYGPLPDDHKQLPFAVIHNHSSFIEEMIGQPSTTSPNTGKEASGAINFNTDERFWTISDPEKVRDLIVLRTDFGRAAFRAAKLAGEVIIATAPGKKFDPNKEWRSGDQAVGMLNQFQSTPLGGNVNLASFDYMFKMIDQTITLTLGIDPLAFADTKQKTAEEAAIQRETGMMRIKMGIRKNEAGGITRLGKLTMKNIQQYYSIPTLKLLTGEEDISQFDEITNDPKTGKPLYGKTYRRIRSMDKYEESVSRHRKSPKQYTLRKSDKGVNSFLSRPQYIRTSEVDVRVLGSNDAGEIKALNRKQYMDALNSQVQLLPFVQTGIVKPEDMGNIRELNKGLMRTFNIPESTALGNSESQKPEDPKQQQMDAFISTMQQHVQSPQASPQAAVQTAQS